MSSVPTSVAAPVTRGRTGRAVAAEEFCFIWATSADLPQALDRLSRMAGRPVPAKSAQARAAGYRRRGIDLKTLMRPKRRPRVPVDRLAPSAN
jgi:hypothetical protein